MTSDRLAVSSAGDFQPAHCCGLADRLDGAIVKFEQWELPVKPLGRLRTAIKLLRRVAAEGTFGTDPRRLTLIANAVMVAGDLAQVSYFLGDKPIERIQKELSRSLKGSLEELDDQRPYDFQAQFWFGTLLGRARFNVVVPPEIGNRRHPDFAITVDTLHCGVEVKRPRSFARARALVSAAADQLEAHGHPGIIVLDIGQCLNVRELHTALLNETVAGPTFLDTRFMDMTRRIAAFVRDSEGPKYRSVVAMIVYCRFPYWRQKASLTARFAWMFAMPPFSEAYGGRGVKQVAEFQARLRAATTEFLGVPPIYADSTP